MSKMPHVALLIESSRAFGRGILRGVIRYQREHGPWSIFFEPHGLESAAPPWIKRWRGDGILARINSPQLARLIRQTGLPAVDMRFAIPDLNIPSVGIDNRAVVTLALQHLTNCGFRQFAFCGSPRRQNPWMDLRCALFQQMVAANGSRCYVFDSVEGRQSNRVAWEKTQNQIGKWLLKLPKPIGVMACNDDFGRNVLDACRRVDIRVPDEVAVIGVDNDEIQCELSCPPLTSVNINTLQVGYEAAALLGRLMSGTPVPAEPLLLAPQGVIARASTDVLAIDDRELSEAIRFIRQHACEGLRVKELVLKITISRRELERKFLDLLGRSPKEEILRVQTEQAKQLLTLTDLPVRIISAKCGFSEPKYFSQVFHARVGLSPIAYRKSKKL